MVAVVVVVEVACIRGGSIYVCVSIRVYEEGEDGESVLEGEDEDISLTGDMCV